MSVSREEVLWCYRKLLHREPESEDVVAAHMGSRDFRALVDVFATSAEFQQRGTAPVAAVAVAETPVSIGTTQRYHPLALAPMEVEVDADPNQLAQAVEKVRGTWAHLGRTRPHYSVLTDDGYLPANIAGSSARFWKTGEAEAEIAEQMRQRHDARPARKLTCVEYGCGLGRVTLALARIFGRVHGFDISAEHLKHAQARAAEVRAPNVSFHDCARDFPGQLPGCDFFYSRIVFQHNPPPIMVELVKAALRCLNPQGIAIFQLPVYRQGYRFRLKQWLKRDGSLEMEMHCLPQEVVFALVAAAGCTLLEVREDNSTGTPETFISNTFVVRRP